MKNSRPFNLKFSDGNSNENIELVEIRKSKYVKKTWNDSIRGSEAIRKQIFFEEIISGQVRIRTPKVIDSYTDDKNKFVAVMEYIEGYSGSDLHKISTIQLSKNLRNAFSLIISKSYEQSTIRKIEPKILISKLDSIKNIRSINFISEYIDIIKNFILSLKEISIPIGSCHGDLTTSNIIATGYSSFYLIDFLPTFLETPLWDIVKIKQDLEYGWTTRYLKGYAMNNAVILNDYIIPHQINKFEANDSIVNLFDAINITRLAPYIKDDRTKSWILEKLLFCTSKLHN